MWISVDIFQVIVASLYSEYSLASYPNIHPLAILPLFSSFSPHHKTQPFIFTLAFPALVQSLGSLEGKVKGRLMIKRCILTPQLCKCHKRLGKYMRRHKSVVVKEAFVVQLLDEIECPVVACLI